VRSSILVIAAYCLATCLGCGSAYVDDGSTSETTVALEVTAPQPSLNTPAAPEPRPQPEPAVEQVRDWTAVDFGEFIRRLPANPMGEGDGFEKHREWSVVGWANPADVAAWKRQDAGDDVALIVRLKGGTKDKSAAIRSVEISLAKRGTLSMDVYNSSGRNVGIAFAVHASVDDVYSESTLLQAAPGWSRLSWDLAASTYKTEASGWENKVPIWGASDIRKLVLLFYDAKEVALAVDRIEADLDEVAPQPEQNEAVGGAGGE
jgi:hypothetical protein